MNKIIAIVITLVIITLLVAVPVALYFKYGRKEEDTKAKDKDKPKTTTTATTQAPKQTWQSVNNRLTNETDTQWSGRIFDAIVGDPIGTRKTPYEGGVATNAGLLTGLNTLTTDTRNKLCANPCEWYYVKNIPNRPKVDNAGLCNCPLTPPVAL